MATRLVELVLVAILAGLLAWRPVRPALSVRVLGESALLSLTGLPAGDLPRVQADGNLLAVEPSEGHPGRFLVSGLPPGAECELGIEASGQSWRLAKVRAGPPFAALLGPAPGRSVRLRILRAGLFAWEGDARRSWTLPAGIHEIPAPLPGGPWRLVRRLGPEREAIAWEPDVVLAAWSEEASLRPSPGKEFSGQAGIPLELASAVARAGPLDGFAGWHRELLAAAPDPRVARKLWNRIHGWRSLVRGLGLGEPDEPDPWQVERGRPEPPSSAALDCPILPAPPPGYGLVESLAHEGDVPLPGDRGPAVYLRWPEGTLPEGAGLALILTVEEAPASSWFRLSELEVGGDGFRVEFPPEASGPALATELRFVLDPLQAPPGGVLLEVREWATGPERPLRLVRARVEPVGSPGE